MTTKAHGRRAQLLHLTHVLALGGVVLLALGGCSRSRSGAGTATSATATSTATPPPPPTTVAAPRLPAEPPPPLPDMKDVPTYEAALGGDAAYQAIWTDGHRADRDLFLTAVSEILESLDESGKKDLDQERDR